MFTPTSISLVYDGEKLRAVVEPGERVWDIYPGDKSRQEALMEKIAIKCMWGHFNLDKEMTLP